MSEARQRLITPATLFMYQFAIDDRRITLMKKKVQENVVQMIPSTSELSKARYERKIKHFREDNEPENKSSCCWIAQIG